MRIHPIAYVLMLSGSVATVPAGGQSLDYGRFEGMFDEPVTISATGKPQRVSDTPVTMDVITAEAIKRSGARDLPTLLKRLPGIDTYNGSPGTEEVAMGGYVQILGARVMVLLNGRQIYLGLFGEVFWSSIPVELDEIRQIEVIRGPQSALYGFNAVDGVINIITFDPAEDKVDFARVRIGSDARRDGSASVTQSLAEGVGVRLTVASDHAHDQGGIGTPIAEPVVPTKNPDREMASANFSAILPDGDRAALEASHSDISQRSVLAGTSFFFDARLRTDAVKADYTADTAIGRIGAAASFTLSESPEAYFSGIGNFTAWDRTSDAQIYDLFKITPSDSVRLGLEARYENMNITNFSSGAISGRLMAGSAMWDHQFLPNLSIVNALRYDYFHLGRKTDDRPGDIYTDADYDRSVQGYSLNSSLIYRPTDADSLRASFSRGLSLPSLLDYGQLTLFTPQVGGNYFYGNPDLNPSAIYEERLGWDRRIDAIDALARLSLYHEQTMHIIASPLLNFPTPAPPECNPNNPLTVSSCFAQGYAKGTGVVVNGAQLQLDRQRSDGLSWGINYSYEKIHPHMEEAAANLVQSLDNTEPVHKVNAAIGYGWQQWSADLHLFYSSSTKGATVVLYPAPNAAFQTVKDVVTLSPNISWRPLDHLTLDLTVQNLWDYKDSVAQRMFVTYFLSAKVSY